MHIILQGRIQDFYEGGSTCSTHAKRAKKFSDTLTFRRTTPIVCVLNGCLATDQLISKIYTKVSETKSLLATIIVREGVLLVHNCDILVLEQCR